MNYRITYSDEYLAHHGILGQKWGIRRFRNYDGTLTADGKRRYGIGEVKDQVKKRIDSQYGLQKELMSLKKEANTKMKPLRSEFQKAYVAYQSLPTPENTKNYIKASNAYSDATR